MLSSLLRLADITGSQLNMDNQQIEKQFASLYQITHLARIFFPTFPSHLSIILLCLAAAMVTAIVRLYAGGDLWATLLLAGYVALGGFFAWVYGRDIDPDQERTAQVSAFIAFVLVYWQGPFGILPVFLLIQLIRALARPVGPPIRLLDSLSIVVVVALVMISIPNGWLFGVIASAAFVLDGVLETPNRSGMVFALLTFAVTVGTMLWLRQVTAPAAASLASLAVAVGASGASILTCVWLKQITSHCDIPDYTFSLARLRAAILLCVAAGLVMLWNGTAGFALMSPLWAALVGMPLYRLAATLWEQEGIG